MQPPCAQAKRQRSGRSREEVGSGRHAAGSVGCDGRGEGGRVIKPHRVFYSGPALLCVLFDLHLAHNTVCHRDRKLIVALGNAAGVYEQLEDYEEAESVLTVTGPPSFPLPSKSSFFLHPLQDDWQDRHSRCK
jgi:hypothetical protein